MKQLTLPKNIFYIKDDKGFLIERIPFNLIIYKSNKNFLFFETFNDRIYSNYIDYSNVF